MNNRAYSEIFNNTLIGSLIGWGGFTQLFPNVLETLGDITHLGSYKALRVFSIVFFLSILILVVSYWWTRGLEIYHKKIAGHRPFSFNYKNSISALMLLLKLLPICLFINNQFFIYNTWYYLFESIIWYYLVIALAQLFIISKKIGKINGIKLLKANTLIFSLDVVLGIGLVCFIEPWAIYKNNFIWETISVGLIYALLSFSIYIYIRTKDNSSIPHFKQFGVAIFVIVLLFSIFPTVNYKTFDITLGCIINTIIHISLPGFVGLFSIFIVLVAYSLYRIIHKKEKFKNYQSLIIGFFVLFIASLTLLYVFGAFLAKANQRYFENRVEASKKISDTKIFPFIVYGDSSINANGFEVKDFALANKDSIALYIAKNNHKWVYKNKLNKPWLSLYPDYNSLAICINWDILAEDNNVRKKYFYYYDLLNQNKKTLTSEKKKLIKKCLEDIKSNQGFLNVFYNLTYEYIHNDIIKTYLNSSIKSNKPITNELRVYFHPINYYTKTLKHYKKQKNAATNIIELNNEINAYSTLDKTNHIDGINIKIDTLISKIDENFNVVNELEDRNYNSLHNTIGSFAQNLENYKKKKKVEVVSDKDSLTQLNKYRHVKSSELVPFFEKLAQLKSKQYEERYKKAQYIFHVYLKDSQRVGIYILIYTLLIACFLYWFYATDELKKDKTSNEICELKNDKTDEPYDLPNRFINILILILSIILIYIARPIKPENINPEQPHWMMNLENWYKPTVFEAALTVTKEDKSSNVKIIKIDNEELLRELAEIKSKMDTSIKNTNSIDSIIKSE